MDNNKKLVEFWNETFHNLPASIIPGKWINDLTFNDTINEYIKAEDTILDFGCGSGWALFEISYTVNLKYGLGIDTSKNAIDSLVKTKELSSKNNLDFKVGNQNLLSNYNDYFNTIISFNVIDVLPNEVIEDVLSKFKTALKDNGYIIISINPDFPLALLEKNGYQLVDSYLFKDGILRGNLKTKNEWIDLFKKYFEFVDYKEFTLVEKEKAFPRRMFILRKNK